MSTELKSDSLAESAALPERIAPAMSAGPCRTMLARTGALPATALSQCTTLPPSVSVPSRSNAATAAAS